MSTDETTDDRQVTMTDQTPDVSDISDEELESQDWTLGGDLDEEIQEIFGMKWRFVEPESQDKIDRLVTPQGGGDNMKQWVQTIIAAPEVTDDKWDDMKPKERTLLTNECMQFFGIDDFIDQDRLMEARESGELDELMEEARDAENRSE